MGGMVALKRAVCPITGQVGSLKEPIDEAADAATGGAAAAVPGLKMFKISL